MFDLLVSLSNGQGEDRAFSHRSGIHVLCKEEEIKYRFDVDELDTYMQDYQSLANTQVTIVLDGVEDLAGNGEMDWEHVMTMINNQH